MAEINRDFLQPTEQFLLDRPAIHPVEAQVHNALIEELLKKLAQARTELDAAYEALAAQGVDGVVDLEEEDDDTLSCMTLENVRDELNDGSVAERSMRVLLTRLVDQGSSIPGPHLVITMSEGQPDSAEAAARWPVPNGVLEIKTFPDGTAKVFAPNLSESTEDAWPAILKLLGSLTI